jgi:modulator of FtsH protease HflC
VAANPSVITYEQAHRWNGQMPATVLGGGTSPLTMFNVPTPPPAAPGGKG